MRGAGSCRGLVRSLRFADGARVHEHWRGQERVTGGWREPTKRRTTPIPAAYRVSDPHPSVKR